MKSILKSFKIYSLAVIIIILILFNYSLYYTNFINPEEIKFNNMSAFNETNKLLNKEDANPSNKSLICVHCYNGDSKIWTDNGWNNSELYENSTTQICYYSRICAINYYWSENTEKPPNYIGKNTSMSLNTNINDIADNLYDYIIDPMNNFTYEIDFLCHSMGGLVVRALVCRHYETLVKKGFLIDDILMLGTPNKGSSISSFMLGTHPFQLILLMDLFDNFEKMVIFLTIANFLFLNNQAIECGYYSPFIESLKLQNADGKFDETPYGKNDGKVWPIENGTLGFHNDIDWTTISGNYPIVFLAMLIDNKLIANFFLLLWMDVGTDGLVGF